MWQIDCANFLSVEQPFEVRDVTTEEQRRFVQAFARDHKLTTTEQGTTILFEASRN
jgi:hypothetical protein